VQDLFWSAFQKETMPVSREKSRQKRNRFQLDIEPQARFDRMYVTLMAVAGALAAVAFLVNSIPILIGSMVVAPVMPPLILISIGMANRNGSTVLKGLGISLAGLCIALLCTVATTWLLSVTGINAEHLQISELLQERVHPGWYSVVAAFAAGIAGALAVLHKKQDTLVGVVASIAVVPTISAVGISALSGNMKDVLGGLVILGLNAGMIVVMGWVVFSVSSVSSD